MKKSFAIAVPVGVLLFLFLSLELLTASSTPLQSSTDHPWLQLDQIGGPTTATAINDKYIVYTEGRTLVAMTHPTAHPQPIGRASLTNFSNEVTLLGDYVVVGNNGYFADLFLIQPTGLTQVTQQLAIPNGRYDATDQHLVIGHFQTLFTYALNTNGLLEFINSRPTDHQSTGSVDTFGNHVYLRNTNSLTETYFYLPIDLSKSAIEIGSLPLFPANQMLVGNESTMVGIHICPPSDEPYPIPSDGCRDELQLTVLDIDDPAEPTIVRQIRFDSFNAAPPIFNGKQLYVSETDSNRYYIFEFADSAGEFGLATTLTTGFDLQAAGKSELLVTAFDSLRAITDLDLSIPPTALFPFFHFPGEHADHIAASDDLVLATVSNLGSTYIFHREHAKLNPVGLLSASGPIHGAENTVYMSIRNLTGAASLIAFASDASNANGVISNTVPVSGPSNYLWLQSANGHLLAGGFGTLDVYSLADPLAPQLVHESSADAFMVNGSSGSVTAHGNTLFTLVDDNVFTIDITTPSAPAVLSSEVITNAVWLHYTENWLVVNQNLTQLQVFDTTNPASLQLVATVENNAALWGRGLSSIGDTLIAHRDGVETHIDLSDPSAASIVSFLSSSGTLRDRWIDSPHIYSLYEEAGIVYAIDIGQLQFKQHVPLIQK